jgi:hypothetical protein
MRDACRLIRDRIAPPKRAMRARSSVAGTANEHKAANSADAADAINQLSRRKALANAAASHNVVEQRSMALPRGIEPLFQP